jgi:sugar phosphate isomerase/epimerase
MPHIGIAAQLFTVRDFMKTPADTAAALQKVKTIGYDAVQLSGLGPIEPQELADILQAEQLQAVITHVSWERLQHDLDNLIADHHRWGCPNVAIGSMPREYQHPRGFVQFGVDATEVGKKLAAAGLTFSYHNHSFEFVRFDGMNGLEALYAHADPRYLLAELDTYWIQHGGADPAEWITRMKGRQVVVHLKDMEMLNGQQTMAEVGEGNLNWPSILAALRATEVPWVAVEQDVCKRDPFESLAISLRNLRGWGV